MGLKLFERITYRTDRGIMRAEVVRDKRFSPSSLSLFFFRHDQQIGMSFRSPYLWEKRLSTGRDGCCRDRADCAAARSALSSGNKTMHGERVSKWRPGQTRPDQARLPATRGRRRCDCACVIYCCRDTIILFRRRAPRLIIGGPRDHSALFRIYFRHSVL